jgi:hypothetical protein
VRHQLRGRRDRHTARDDRRHKEPDDTVDEGEDGGDVDFDITVKNTGDVDITFDTIVDDPDNNPATNNSVTYDVADICPGAPVAVTLLGGQDPDDEITCTITGVHLQGDAGESFTDKACVSGTDENQNTVSDCDDETVTIGDVEPTATVTKSVLNTQCATVRYNVKVENDSDVDELTLTRLCDDKFGTIVGEDCPDGTEGVVEATGCAVPQTIAIGGNYQCTFDAEVCEGDHEDTVTATIEDDDGTPVDPSPSGTVKVGNGPPNFETQLEP